MNKCKKCSKEFKGHGNAKYCENCGIKVAGSPRKISRTKIRSNARSSYQKRRKTHICQICKKQLDYKESKKFCKKCKDSFLLRMKQLHGQACFVCGQAKKKQIYCSKKCYKIGNYFLKTKLK